jgi:hypothetical protein
VPLWALWLTILTIIALIFWWLWRFADRIEQEEAMENQWKQYIASVAQIDPYAAMAWQQYYEQTILKRKG